MTRVTLTLIGKPDCHLCDDARKVVWQVQSQLPQLVVEEVSLEDNPLWDELYGELIPVVLLNGVQHAHWKIDSDSLRQAVEAALETASESR